jgi:hypothetical protein
MTFKKFLLGCITGIDNKTPDVGRILLIVGVFILYRYGADGCLHDKNL